MDTVASLAGNEEVISGGFKYLGFFLNPNAYSFKDWIWLYKKVESHISCWANRDLSIGGFLTLLKEVL